jgi:hypothetical protein
MSSLPSSNSGRPNRFLNDQHSHKENTLWNTDSYSCGLTASISVRQDLKLTSTEYNFVKRCPSSSTLLCLETLNQQRLEPRVCGSETSDWLPEAEKSNKTRDSQFEGLFPQPSRDGETACCMMEPIDDKATFSRVRLLNGGTHSQVCYCTYRIGKSRKIADKVNHCILKFFPNAYQIRFQKEVETYNRLLESDTPLRYANPLGASKWSGAKYIKTIGKTIGGEIEPLPDVSVTSSVYVLMLEYVEGDSISDSLMSLETAKAALESLKMLHQLRIAHGDISVNNIIELEDDGTTKNAVWIDFSCSWIDASSTQIQQEWKIAVEYFSTLVTYLILIY